LLKTVRTVYFSQANRSPKVKPFGIGLFAGYLGGAGGPLGGVGAGLDCTATAVEEAPYDSAGPLGRGGAGMDEEEIGAATEDEDPMMVMVVVHVVSPP
jgi:hypothetical protein